jgi:Zn-dependent protease
MKSYVRAKRLSVCGAPVFLHWSALVVIGGCLAMAVSDPIVAIIAAASYFSVILVHEFGHAFVASRLGYEVDSIRLSVIHGECIYMKRLGKRR